MLLVLGGGLTSDKREVDEQEGQMLHYVVTERGVSLRDVCACTPNLQLVPGMRLDIDYT